MEKIVVKWFITNGYVGIGIFCAIIFITIAIVLRVNSIINKFKADDKERSDMREHIKLLDKRTNKMLCIMGLCKSVTTPNKLWVQNDKRNGGVPPDNYSLCELEDDSNEETK